MSIPKPPYAEGQEFTNDVTGVTYKFDGVKWIAAGSGEEIDLSGYVRKEGGDSMEGPLNMRPQAGADTRQTNRVQTLGVFSNSAASSLRLGTDRDRVYVGNNDTSFNGPIKVAELQEKNAGGGISTTHKIVVRANGIVERPVPSGTAGDGFAFQGRVEGGSATQIKDKLLSVYHNSGSEPDAVNYQGKTSNPDNIQSRKSVLSITDPIQDGVDQNAADIRTLFQDISEYLRVPVTFRCKGYLQASSYSPPPEGHFCIIYSSSNSTSANVWFGNCNHSIKIHKDNLLSPNNAEIASDETYELSGYVTVIGDDHKVYLKAPIERVRRNSGMSYVTIYLSSPVTTWANGRIDDAATYMVLVEAYQAS